MTNILFGVTAFLALGCLWVLRMIHRALGAVDLDNVTARKEFGMGAITLLLRSIDKEAGTDN